MKIVALNAKLALLGATILFLSVSRVWAQIAPVPSNNLSDTIAVSNTFQAIQGKANNRLGCTIQNNATVASGDLMWVFFDKSNSANCSAATKGASVSLQPGQAVNCMVNTDNVLGDQICITGTATDHFFANFQ
jgi:hypothetical protein